MHEYSGEAHIYHPVAEALTGWRGADVMSRPLGDVFVILNETSRQQLDTSAHRVVKEGIVQGMAAGTLLISRDGQEIPIDHSGAAIRDRAGHIVGAVLVFRDITTRNTVENDLRATAARLSRSNEDLTACAHAINHDLHEPLRAVGAFSQLLALKYKGKLDADADEHIQFITGGVRRMSAMVQDLLTYSTVLNSGDVVSRRGSARRGHKVG